MKKENTPYNCCPCSLPLTCLPAARRRIVQPMLESVCQKPRRKYQKRGMSDSPPQPTAAALMPPMNLPPSLPPNMPPHLPAILSVQDLQKQLAEKELSGMEEKVDRDEFSYKEPQHV